MEEWYFTKGKFGGQIHTLGTSCELEDKAQARTSACQDIPMTAIRLPEPGPWPACRFFTHSSAALENLF